jgi:MerR family transcriptional regulator, heat shock protein HspR
MQNKPLYTIGAIAEFLEVHPETIRVWERRGLVKPSRRNRQRLYTDTDLKRLVFVQELLSKGLNLAGISEVLSFYSCWLCDECKVKRRKKNSNGLMKRCWREKSTYCPVSSEEQILCENCQHKIRANSPC